MLNGHRVDVSLIDLGLLAIDDEMSNKLNFIFFYEIYNYMKTGH